MAKSTLPKTEAPEEIRPTAELSKARADAINEHIRTGYLDSKGNVRPITGRAHCEFLAKGGTIPPLPE